MCGGVGVGVVGVVRIIIDFCHMGNRGGTWPSAYCVFEHLIFMDLRGFKKRPSLTSIRL